MRTLRSMCIMSARPGGNTSRPSKQYDRVHKLSQIRTPEEFAVWKQHGAVTSQIIDEITSEVRRLVDSADFDSAHRLSDWCLLLAADAGDPMTRARG